METKRDTVSHAICNAIMDQFCRLDKDERLPVRITLHLLFCKKCRTSVRMMTLAEKAAAVTLQSEAPADNPALLAIMEHISKNCADPAKRKMPPVTLWNWGLGGVFMTALLLVFAVLNAGSLSHFLMIVFYLVFAAAVTLYCALFVGSNMDFFVKKIDNLSVSLHQMVS